MSAQYWTCVFAGVARITTGAWRERRVCYHIREWHHGGAALAAAIFRLSCLDRAHVTLDSLRP